MKGIQPILLSVVYLFFSINLTNAGTWATLDFPGASQTHISGIDGDNIVGYYGASNSQHGFLYDGNNWTTIDMPTAKATVVRGISGNVIVGEYSDSIPFSPWHSFLYDGTNWVTIPLKAGDGLDGFSYGIDGDIIVSSNQIYNIATQSLTILNYPGATRTMICGVDGSNLVGSYDNHGFIYNMTTQNWTTIDVPGATYTRIYGIDGGNLVGSSTLNGEKLNDFIYDGTTLLALDVPGSPSGIYGNTIVGSYITTIYYDNVIGVFSHGYVYTIPEPATLLLFALGGLALRKSRLAGRKKC